MSARADILGPDALEYVGELMARKYRVDRILILPLYRAVRALKHRGTPHGGPVIIAITPGS